MDVCVVGGFGVNRVHNGGSNSDNSSTIISYNSSKLRSKKRDFFLGFWGKKMG